MGVGVYSSSDTVPFVPSGKEGGPGEGEETNNCFSLLSPQFSLMLHSKLTYSNLQGKEENNIHWPATLPNRNLYSRL